MQHHVTNIAGLAAIQFFPILMGKTFSTYTWTATSTWDSHTWLMAFLALIIAAVFGVFTALLGEFCARLWYDRGTSHIDPRPPPSGSAIRWSSRWRCCSRELSTCRHDRNRIHPSYRRLPHEF